MSTAQAIQDAVQAVKGQASPEEPEVVTEDPEVELQEDVILEDNIEVIETDDSPTIEAPNSWSKEDKEHFSTLPRDVQERVSLRERERDLNIRKTQDETAAERKAIEAERKAVSELKADYLDRLKTSTRKPSEDLLDPDSDSYDPDAYHLAIAKLAKVESEAKKLEDELSLEQANERRAWQENEIKVYQEVLPEFVDPEKGQAFRQKLADYAVKTQGITMEQAAQVFPVTPAKEMAILYKAMKYDEAVARTKSAKTTPKPKSLPGGSNNPEPAKVIDRKSAVRNWASNRSPAAAAALLGLNRK